MANKQEKLDKEDLEDELTVSCNKYMICSVCELPISFSQDGDEDRMIEHFKEKHNYKED